MKNHPHITNMRELEQELHRLHERLNETESRMEQQWRFGKQRFWRLCLNSVKCGRRKGETDPLFAGSEFIKEIINPLGKNFLRWILQKFRK